MDAVCPRCGHRNKFRQGRLPATCVCMVCESQLDWRNIPGCGPDCRPLSPDDETAPSEPRPAAEVPGMPATPAVPAAESTEAEPEAPAAAVEHPARPRPDEVR